MLIGQHATDVLVWTRHTDMRKSIDGLCLLVSGHMDENPCSGKIFVFFNRVRDKLKLIYWSENGFCLLYKRLEKGRFQVPASADSVSLTRSQLQLLLQGLPLKHWPKTPLISYEKYG